MRRNTQYFGKKMVNLYTNNVLDWENDRLFRDNLLAKIASHPLRMYYQYPDWSDINENFARGQVLSAFTYGNASEEKLMIAYESQRQSGLVSLASVTRTDETEGTSSMGLTYVSYDLEREECCEECMCLKRMEENIRSYCLMLPYLLPRKDFRKQIAIVFNDWDVMSIDGKKVEMRPCKNVFHN